MSYQAVVCRLTNVRKHPNADRLQLATALGSIVVVGLDNYEEELGVMFITDGRLSEEMCAANDLVRRKNPVTGAHEGGFFEENRRIRAQPFRGQKSDGYWTPLSALAWTGFDVLTLKEGDAFDTLGGYLICEKYYTPATLRAMQTGQKVKRGATKYFPKQPDIPQFRFVAEAIPIDSIIWITEKVHGTSHRIAHVLDDIPLSWWKHQINRLYQVFAVHQRYTTLNGSKNVILEKTTGVGYYGTNEFRYKAVEQMTVRKGECIYFEICGYVDEQTQIMGSQPIQDKEVKQRYGDLMTYTYGTKPGEQALFVYRITQVNEEGHITELPWVQVVARCRELGLTTVPFLAGPIVFTGEVEALRLLTESLIEGPSSADLRHIREGVVVRAESAEGTFFAKNKSWLFGVLEGYIKDDENYVDTEEVA